tara:strand:+ start:331 stop:480 length:150 start_codon:yes stop_codon:yes gene_type:complete
MENGATDAEKHGESKFTAKNAPTPQKSQKAQKAKKQTHKNTTTTQNKIN